MEESLKLFELGFLLRSLFAGIWFPIAYYVFSHRPPPYYDLEFEREQIISIGFPVALLAGVIAYSLHRSLIYPVIEACLDCRRLVRLRRTCCCYKKRNFCPCLSLITKATVERIRRDWDKSERGANSTLWADFAHQQYCSAICMGLGAVAAKYVAEFHEIRTGLLTGGILVFAVAGLTADWRLRTVKECLADPAWNSDVSSRDSDVESFQTQKGLLDLLEGKRPLKLEITAIPDQPQPPPPPSSALGPLPNS
jgi:hypothetical protein